MLRNHHTDKLNTISFFTMETRFASMSVLELSPAKRLHLSTKSPPALESVSNQPLSFSISKILGIEHNGTARFASPNSVRTEPLKYSASSPSFHVDVTSSSGDCDSEPDQQPTHSEAASKKKRQRTTFSPQEVWAMERAFKRCSFLHSELEDDLVQRLGIPARSLRFWFQNRRAKAKREKKAKKGVRQTTPSNNLEWPEALRFPIQCPPYPPAAEQVAHIPTERLWQGVDAEPRYQPRLHSTVRKDLTATNDRPRYKLQMETGDYCPTRPIQLRNHSFRLPVVHHHQPKYVPSFEPSRRRYSRPSSFQPY